MVSLHFHFWSAFISKLERMVQMRSRKITNLFLFIMASHFYSLFSCTLNSTNIVFITSTWISSFNPAAGTDGWIGRRQGSNFHDQEKLDHLISYCTVSQWRFFRRKSIFTWIIPSGIDWCKNHNFGEICPWRSFNLQRNPLKLIVLN